MLAVASLYYMRKTPLTSNLIDISSWGYQLQNLNLAEIRDVQLDLLVIDHADDRGQAWSSEVIDQLKTNPDGSHRLLLAYLSIGEAERYRSYWEASWDKAPPVWLGNENPNWQGNYAVDYANDEWQRLIFGQKEALLDVIINQGFDGVYLDRVDAYYGLGLERRSEMITFVAELSSYARSIHPDFLVIQQNAEELLTDASHRETVDGLAKEDLLFNVRNAGEENPPSMIIASTRFIDLIAQEHKPVLVVEYDLNQDQAEKASRAINELGYTLALANRRLSSTPAQAGGMR